MTMDSVNNVPNLDAMSKDQLMRFWSRMRFASRIECENIVGDRRPGYTTLVKSTLTCYASNKATAMRLREQGEIARALEYERICDRIYDEIPTDLRW